MRRALAGSSAIHAVLGALYVFGVPLAGRDPVEVPPIEVELVQEPPMRQGAPATAEASHAEAAPADSVRASDGDAAAAPAPPAPDPARGEQSTAVNLGDGPRDLEGMSVTGDHVVPPEPDSAYRNRPPAYPQEAARVGAQGTVLLVVRVSARGLPEQVQVATSSGHATLDRAAREAVLRWHFRPAVAGGAPIPYDFQINIRFLP
ncbi:MAG: hypothetical protein NVSMB18_21160 [Acetobacteraceae bacterium]